MLQLRDARRAERGDVPIYLLVKSPGTPSSDTVLQRRSYERHWTPVHLDVVVDEIEPAVERSVSAGAQLEKPIATHNCY
ncbi:MAG: VOC family protein [Steroidobacteraceae bacterium]